MPSWAEAQYVINELREDIHKVGTVPNPINDIYTIRWGGGLIDFYLGKDCLPEIEQRDSTGTILNRIENVFIVSKKGSYPLDEKDGTRHYFFSKEHPLVDRELVYSISIRYPEEENYDDWFYTVYTISTNGNVSSGFRIVESETGLTDPNDLSFYYRVINTVYDPEQKINDGVQRSSDSYLEPKRLTANVLSRKNEKLIAREGKRLFRWQRHFLQNVLKNYPAAVNDDGTVRYWLDPTDYRKKIDGSESDWNNPDFDGNFCAWINWVSIYQSWASISTNPLFGISSGDFKKNPTVNSGNDFAFEDYDRRITKGFWLPMLYYVENAFGSTKRHFKSDIDMWFGSHDPNAIINSPGEMYKYFLSTADRNENVSSENKNQNIHRLPMFSSHYELLNVLMTLLGGSFDPRDTYGFGSTMPKSGIDDRQTDIIGKNDLVNDDPESPIISPFPGFHKGSDDASETSQFDGYVKIFHSIFPFSNRLVCMDTSFERVYATAYRLWPGMTQLFRIREVAPSTVFYNTVVRDRIGGGMASTESSSTWKNFFICSDEEIGKDVTNSYFIESINEGASQGQPTSVKFTSDVGNSQPQVVGVYGGTTDYGPSLRYTFNRNDINFWNSPYAYMFCLNYTDPVHSSRNKFYLKTYIPTILVPDPDYDPFEATGYKPWLTESID